MSNHEQQPILDRTDLRGIAKDYQDVITYAQSAGWSARRLSGGGVLLTSHDGSGTTLRIPLSTKANASAVRRMRSTIAKHPSGQALALALAVVEHDVKPSRVQVPAVAPAPVARRKPRHDDLPGEHLRVTSAPEPEQQHESTPEPPRDATEREGDADDTFTGVRPWLANKGPGRSYPSAAVHERVRDGVVVAYVCTLCDAEHDSDPHWVAAHYRRAHRLGKGRAPVAPSVPTDGVGYTPSERLLDALADAFIAGGVDETWTPRDLAHVALTWMRTRPDRSARPPRRRADRAAPRRRPAGAGHRPGRRSRAADHGARGAPRPAGMRGTP